MSASGRGDTPVTTTPGLPVRGFARDRGPASPYLVSIATLSRLLDRSVPSLERDDAAGRIPAGVRIGSSKRWRLSEIDAWVRAGCPSRDVWTGS